MASYGGSDNVFAVCEECRYERCSCYCSECWQRGKVFNCSEHRSVKHSVGGDDWYVIIVTGIEKSSNIFRDSCFRLRDALRDRRFLGLSDGNAFVVEASSGNEVRLRLLSLKLLLENKAVDKACCHVSEACCLSPEYYDDMRKQIVTVCTQVWRTVALERCLRRIGIPSSKTVALENLKMSLVEKIFNLAWKRAKDLKIYLNQGANIEFYNEKAKDVLAMFHLWENGALEGKLMRLRSSEENMLGEWKNIYSVQNLGRTVDEFFRVVMSTSGLSVSSEAFEEYTLPAVDPSLLQTMNNSDAKLLATIIKWLQPLQDGLLWYYYCGQAKGRGDDQLEDNVLPKALLEATGRLVANLIVTLDCSHADVNMPNIVHFVENGPVFSSYTAIASCTARQLASHGDSQAFTEFLACGLSSAIEDCRSVFRRCYRGQVCAISECNACTNFQDSKKDQCKTCITFRSSTRKFRALTDVFDFVKAHLCPYSMYPLMRRSRPNRILPIAYVYNDKATSIQNAPEHLSCPQIGMGDHISQRCQEMFSEMSRPQYEASLGVPSITSGCTNAHVVIVSGAGKDAGIFRRGCLKLQETLTDSQFVGVSHKNVAVIEATSDKEVQLKLLSILLHLEDKVINSAYLRVLDIPRDPAGSSEDLRQSIVQVCTRVRKRLARGRCQRKNTFLSRAILAPKWCSSDYTVLHKELFRMAWRRFVECSKLQEYTNVGNEEIDSVTFAKRAKTLLTLSYLWQSNGKENNIAIDFRLCEKDNLSWLAQRFKDMFSEVKHPVSVLGLEVDKCFRELISTPFIPVSTEALKENGKSYEVIVDSLRPLSNEVLWYHYCGHAKCCGDDSLDEEVLPKALLEATGQLVAHMIVSLDCCHAESNIPDIVHFTDDRLCSSFSVLASCTARQTSDTRNLPAFTQFFIYALKSASEVCRDAFNDVFYFESCRVPNCGACKIAQENNTSCETCSNFRSSAESSRTLADIFNFVKAHLCPKRMYPVLREAAIKGNLYVARTHVKEPTGKTPLHMSVMDHNATKEQRLKIDGNLFLTLFEAIVENLVLLSDSTSDNVNLTVFGDLTDAERNLNVENRAFVNVNESRCFISALAKRLNQLGFITEQECWCVEAELTERGMARQLICACEKYRGLILVVPLELVVSIDGGELVHKAYLSGQQFTLLIDLTERTQLEQLMLLLFAIVSTMPSRPAKRK